MKVIWDDDIHKKWQPNHQPVLVDDDVPYMAMWGPISDTPIKSWIPQPRRDCNGSTIRGGVELAWHRPMPGDE